MKKAKPDPDRFTFDRKTTSVLRYYYEQAVKEGKTEFHFAGRLLLVDYTKYLLEYLESRLGVK